MTDDLWHWGTVAAVSFAVLCEVWHGYCQHSRSVSDQGGYRPQNPTTDKDRAPLLDSVFMRSQMTSSMSRMEDGVRVVTEASYGWTPRVSAKALFYAPIVRAAGRFALASVVIAGFAVREFTIPWFT